MTSQSRSINIHLCLGHKIPHIIMINDLDKTIGDMKTYIRENIRMNMEGWRQYSQNTYSLELHRVGDIIPLDNTETIADLICDDIIYDNDILNIHIIITRNITSCSLFSCFRPKKEDNFPIPNHNYLFAWNTICN